jgi:hypothetical protein
MGALMALSNAQVLYQLSRCRFATQTALGHRFCWNAQRALQWNSKLQKLPGTLMSCFVFAKLLAANFLHGVFQLDKFDETRGWIQKRKTIFFINILKHEHRILFPAWYNFWLLSMFFFRILCKHFPLIFFHAVSGKCFVFANNNKITPYQCGTGFFNLTVSWNGCFNSALMIVWIWCALIRTALMQPLVWMRCFILRVH